MSFQQRLAKLPKRLPEDYPIFKYLVLSELRNGRFGETVDASRGYKLKYGGVDDKVFITVKDSGEITIKVSNGYTPKPKDLFKPEGLAKAYDVKNYRSYQGYLKSSTTFPYKEAVDQVLSVLSEAEIYLSKPYYIGKVGYEVPKSYEFSYIAKTQYIDPLTDNVKIIRPKNSDGEYINEQMTITVK